MISEGRGNPPPLSCRVEKRRDQRNCVSLIPPLLNTATQGGGGGGVHGRKNPTPPPPPIAISQLRALATHTPSLGCVGQGAWELGFAQTRRRYFLSDPCMFGYIF